MLASYEPDVEHCATCGAETEWRTLHAFDGACGPACRDAGPDLAKQLGVDFGYLALVFAGLATVLDVCGSRWGAIAARVLAAIYAFGAAYYLRPARRRR